MIVDDMILGYLVDEPWLRELAISLKIIGKPNPAELALYPGSIHRQLIRSNEFEAARSVGKRLIVKLDIPGLRMSPVWISNSKSCLCWSLPYSMQPSERSKEDTARLEYFKEVVGAEGEPIWWPSTDGDVPPIMRKVSKPRADYWAMSINSLPGWDVKAVPNYERLPGASLPLDEDGYEIYPPPFIRDDEAESDVETLRPPSPPPSTVTGSDKSNSEEGE